MTIISLASFTPTIYKIQKFRRDVKCFIVDENLISASINNYSEYQCNNLFTRYTTNLHHIPLYYDITLLFILNQIPGHFQNNRGPKNIQDSLKNSRTFPGRIEILCVVCSSTYLISAALITL